jgi:hypothetical protein
MRSFFIVLSLLLSGATQAALVDNGSYTKDTVSGLKWLDLSTTGNMTMVDALAANSGWRLASNAEVEDLFAQLFVGYYDSNVEYGLSIWEDYWPEENIQGAYAGHVEDSEAFLDLFGVVRSDSGGERELAHGLYFDEDGIVRAVGVDHESGYVRGVINGLESVYDRSYNYETSASTSSGTFLVQGTLVPIPASVWLFGSALAGLGWMRRKQTV